MVKKCTFWYANSVSRAWWELGSVIGRASSECKHRGSLLHKVVFAMERPLAAKSHCCALSAAMPSFTRVFLQRMLCSNSTRAQATRCLLTEKPQIQRDGLVEGDSGLPTMSLRLDPISRSAPMSIFTAHWAEKKLP